MTFKIERVPFKPYKKDNTFREFILALKTLKVGESFSVSVTSMSNYRMAISIMQIVMDQHFSTRTEGKSVRVARLI